MALTVGPLGVPSLGTKSSLTLPEAPFLPTPSCKSQCVRILQWVEMLVSGPTPGVSPNSRTFAPAAPKGYIPKHSSSGRGRAGAGVSPLEPGPLGNMLCGFLVAAPDSSAVHRGSEGKQMNEQLWKTLNGKHRSTRAGAVSGGAEVGLIHQEASARGACTPPDRAFHEHFPNWVPWGTQWRKRFWSPVRCGNSVSLLPVPPTPRMPRGSRKSCSKGPVESGFT